jgi:hypothetical protein
MISLLTALVILTNEPCPNHANLKRVQVVFEARTEHGCGIIYNDQIVYALDNGQQVKTEAVKQNDKK